MRSGHQNQDKDNMNQYKCSECGEDWNGESCFGYVNDVCSNCGALEPHAKVEK